MPRMFLGSLIAVGLLAAASAFGADETYTLKLYKSKKGDNDDLKDELEDFRDDLKKIAKSQGDSSGGYSSNGRSSKGDDGESAESGSGQGWISSLLAAIGQFVTALVGAVQGSGQG